MDTQHRGVVVRGMTDEKIPGPFDRGELGQHRAQVILTQLARSAAGSGE